MGHFAQIGDNNLVMQVVVANDTMGEWLNDTVGGVWVQTSYNTRAGVHHNPETGEPSANQSKALRGNYAGIGFTYDETLDAFIPPQPFPSWTIDEGTFSWVAPVAHPEDGGDYTWDEDDGDWVEVEDEAV